MPDETKEKNELSRRIFMKSALSGLGVAAAAGFSSCVAPRILRAETADASAGSLPNPIQAVGKPGTPDGFIGDNPKNAHAILWNKSAYLAKKGGLPAPTETASVVVIGGGIAGLTAAYALRDLRPVLLEQGAQFGGNAKGERWNDLEYSIGSSYIPKPEAGTPLGKLLTELGLDTRIRFESARDEAIMLRGKHAGNHPGKQKSSPTLLAPFWSGASDPARAEEFKRVFNALLAIENENYPAIPARSAKERAHLNALDQLTFAQWVKKNLGTIHPHIEELFHEYCWDSLGGAYDELSAAQVLNFITADLAGGMGALPGGNAAISEALYVNLAGALPEHSLRTRALCVDVTVNTAGVTVTYDDAAGGLRAIQAKACVVTSPKFVARVLVAGLSDQQQEAMGKLRYRAFLVANILINQRVSTKHFGAFNLYNAVPKTEADERRRAFTSMTFASWAVSDRPEHASLSLYRGFPFDSGRSSLSPAKAFAEMRSKFEAEIPALLTALGVDLSKLAGLRIARWGHALPLAAAGMINDGTLERASAPFQGRVFFGQQDNWASPCVESSVNAAHEAAERARAAVKG